MLRNQIIDKLLLMKLPGMVDAWQSQDSVPDIQNMSFDDRFGLIVDAECTRQEKDRLQRRLKSAKLRLSASVEDLDYRKRTGLDKVLVAELSTGKWIHEALNVLITGPTGIGKTYVACAFTNKACRLGFTAAYYRAPRFFQELTLARLNGKYTNLLKRLAKLNLLILDDFALAPLNDEQSRDLLEVVDDRTNKLSMIITSQTPVEHWYDTIPTPAIADAILDRVVHSSYKVSLEGESLRKNKKGKKNDD